MAADANANPSPMRLLRDTLQKVDFLYQLKLDELDHLMGALKKRSCPAGYTVIKEGDPGDAFYMIATGEVEVSAKGKVLTARKAGEFFGESALVNDSRRSATVKTKVAAELYVLYKEDFNKILMANPGIAASIKLAAAQRKTK
jgi:CRP/FNR family cyclic AMP-dependent transcriptional regulator